MSSVVRTDHRFPIRKQQGFKIVLCVQEFIIAK